MSGVASFFLRLVGADPEQKEAERKFKESLKKVDESEARLDDILGDIKRVNKKVKKNRDLTRTMVPGLKRADPTPLPGNGTDG